MGYELDFVIYVPNGMFRKIIIVTCIPNKIESFTSEFKWLYFGDLRN